MANLNTAMDGKPSKWVVSTSSGPEILGQTIPTSMAGPGSVENEPLRVKGVKVAGVTAVRGALINPGPSYSFKAMAVPGLGSVRPRKPQVWDHTK